MFFKSHIGAHFKFNLKFLAWMNENSGSTLKDAINQCSKIKLESKTNNKKKDIDPQFEYNTYLRNFLKANPNLNRDLGIKLWKIKKSMRGHNRYDKGDLELLDSKI